MTAFLVLLNKPHAFLLLLQQLKAQNMHTYISV